MTSSAKLDQYDVMKALENSPKGRLSYNTGWDESPNAITTLITAVQELEVDKPKRGIVENAFKVIQMKERYSLSPSPKTSPRARISQRGRHSLPPVNIIEQTKQQEQPADISRSLLSSLNQLQLRRDKFMKEAVRESRLKIRASLSPSPSRTTTKTGNNEYPPQPELRIEEVSSNSWNGGESDCVDVGNGFNMADKRKLIPPSSIRRKKSIGGSPRFKPSPYSSSCHTQTHSSTTSASASEVTNTTPTRHSAGKAKRYGIDEEMVNEEKLEEDLFLESKASPYAYIEQCNANYQAILEKQVQEAAQLRARQFQQQERENEKKAAEAEKLAVKLRREKDEALKKEWEETERTNLQDIQLRQKNRLKQEEMLLVERKAALDAAERNRQAVQEAARQEQLKLQKSQEEAQKRKEESERLEQQRVDQQKAAEEKAKAEKEAAEAKQKLEELKKSQQVVPELTGLILKEDLATFSKTTEFLRQYEEPASHIDGKSPATKSFYMGAVKCINTPLNALADTSENEIMSKVQHLSKLLAGEQVTAGGSMTVPFSSTSIPQGDLFVFKTLAFRFVKKAEADVTRGKSTVQPLATLGVHLCKQFPAWAALVQAYMYRLCPFLVPFSHPQGDKSIQEYARELGHELSGTETAIQQTFLERLKGYCTLYALMVLKFHSLGSFDIGEATDFFTIGGAWKILVKTIKLEPQVDVTATVIHALLDNLDDLMYAIYKSQFTKLIRLLISMYLPKIKSITPPAKSGSLSRLQIYVEKKYST